MPPSQGGEASSILVSRSSVNRPQTIGEEIFNSIIHGVAALLSLIGFGFLIYKSILTASVLSGFAYIIYSFSLFFLFMMSTMSHSLTHKKAKHVFRILDNDAIFVLIAGTYTPIALIALKEVFMGGWILFGIMWFIAITGITITSIFFKRFEKYAFLFFIGMGWIISFYAVEIFQRFLPVAIILLTIGGVMYTLGCFFYVREDTKFYHAIWHIFVLIGAVVQYCAIYFYI